MVLPPPGYKPVPGKSFEEHRAHKKKLAQDLVDKILAEKDPVRRAALEKELATRHPTHYDIAAQPGWPLNDWPYKGPAMTKENCIPESHFVAKRGLPPEDWAFREKSYATDKHLEMHLIVGKHAKMNPRRFMLRAFSMLSIPVGCYYFVMYCSERRDRSAGRVTGDYRISSKLIQDSRDSPVRYDYG